jgi:hypothetical protein
LAIDMAGLCIDHRFRAPNVEAWPLRQVVWSAAGVTAFTTVRGSIPLFWQEGEAIVTLKPQPEVMTGQNHTEAMRRHFSSLFERY